jgi:pyruvate dehydrogenase E2 component (dihydrolipoamide acetyltransferase)
MLPDLGEGLAEAEILAWHIKPGDHVVVDQPMVSVETAKAVVEVPVPFSGIVTALHGAVGDVLATGSPLVDFDSGTVVGNMPHTSEDEFLDAPSVSATVPLDGPRLRAVPAARALARRLGLELGAIAGSGPDGLIRLDDVLACAGLERRRTAAELEAPPGSSAEPLRGARRAMAHSMSLSRDQVSGSTVCDDADIHGWTRCGGFMVRLVRAMIAACTAEPALNAWYDSANNTRILLEQIDLAVAVDTDGGLIVPVLRDIRHKTPDEVRDAIAAGKESARRRTLQPADMAGFTLMLSNFGTLAGRYGTPLVVPPAVAILGCGSVREAAVAAAGAVVAHRCMPLSLSFDHRCITGGEACRFLAAVIADLEKPE